MLLTTRWCTFDVTTTVCSCVRHWACVGFCVFHCFYFGEQETKQLNNKTDWLTIVSKKLFSRSVSGIANTVQRYSVHCGASQANFWVSDFKLANDFNVKEITKSEVIFFSLLSFEYWSITEFQHKLLSNYLYTHFWFSLLTTCYLCVFLPLNAVWFRCWRKQQVCRMQFHEVLLEPSSIHRYTF